MPVIVITVTTKPDNVEFFSEKPENMIDAEAVSLWQRTLPGLISRDRYSEDPNTVTKVLVWDSMAHKDSGMEMLRHTAFHMAKKKYNEEHGITNTVTVIEQ